MNIHGHIIDFIVAIVLMFLGTLLYFGQKQDSLVQTLVSTETEILVNVIRSQGYLTREMYDGYLEDLSHTGMLYEVSLEHRQSINEPEYRFRTAEEVITEQDTAFTGSNVYTFWPVSTSIPVVTDPVSTGSLNTETNASVLASAVNTPAAASHVHTEGCYTGHRHIGNGSVNGGCYTLPQAHSHISSCYQPYEYTHTHSSGCYSSRTCGGTMSVSGGGGSTNYVNGHCRGKTLTTSYGGYKCGSCGNTGSWGFIISESCGCGYSWSYSGSGGQCSQQIPYLSCTMSEGVTYSGSSIVCGKTDYTIESYGLSCGLILDTVIDCGQIISSILPTHQVQTVALGDPLITTITANFLDGSTKVLVATTSYLTSSVVQNKIATLTYAYSISGIAYSKTCNITVSVIPRSKICVNGHTYNLNSNGSDPGCPYCHAWLSSLTIVNPATGSITIYKGTTLPGNGVTLLATYLDGTTQYLYTEYLDNLDTQFVGTQNVTLSYKGKYVSLTVKTKRNLTLCGVCTRYYELYPDGSDPGCPWCQSRTPIFTGNVLEYFDKNY
ncbi:MAG: hypothetical protein ACYDEX_00660, partial [Mobilitalea sp.]